MQIHIELGSLIGKNSDLKNLEINLGKAEYAEYIIVLPENYDPSSNLKINVENCKFSFANSRKTHHIENLTLVSYTGNVTFSGGITTSQFSYVQNKIAISNPSSLGEIKVITEDYDGTISTIKTKLSAITFGHGTGSATFGSEECFKSLTHMKEDLPKVNYVNFIVTWAGTSLDISNCTLSPGIESTSDHAQWSTSSTHLISKPNGVVNFGRTYFDPELLATVEKAKEMGMKVCITPSIIVDLQGKPWRGEITGSAESVTKFYTTQYKPFISHYLTLLAGKIDAFIIGSELKGITKILTGDSSFPFIDHLIELSVEAKRILGEGCKITYASCWDEYHHTDGGKRPMDKLWSSESIDMVGVNAYFPSEPSEKETFSINDIKIGLTSGRDFSYWLDGSSNKNPLDQEWAVKNIQYWFDSYHYSDGIRTEWKPGMKKIWFTEFGFASLDRTTNDPGKFYEGISASSLPSNSTGHISIANMHRGIVAVLELYGEAIVEQAFAYLWDARDRDWHTKKMWADSDSWYYSHGIEGKLAVVELASTESDIITIAGAAAGGPDPL